MSVVTAEPRPRIAVVVFPGSNDDRDAQLALEGLGAEAPRVWHTETELPDGSAAVILPGGFSYGDYLRAGAIARFSPIMGSVTRFAAEGGLVLGICNGFQILTEARLLPGTLRPNESPTFVCRDVGLRVEHTNSPFASRCGDGTRPDDPGQARGRVLVRRFGPDRELETNRQILSATRRVKTQTALRGILRESATRVGTSSD